MKTKQRIGILVVLVAGFGLLAACNFPRSPSPQEVAQTAAAETVSAQLTQLSQATSTLPPTIAPPPPLETATAPPPTSPPPTATTGCADNSQFVSDVTIPDNSNLGAGVAFTKTWRLRNTGTCPWTTGFDVVFVDGNGMSGPASVPLAGQVPPGSTVDVSVNLVAPSTNGTHRGNYRLRNDQDVLFGTVFYVQIVVGPTPTPKTDVYRSGKITIDNDASIDFDGGTTTGDPKRDLWLHFVSPSERYIEPRNGALFLKMSGVPDIEDCKDASLSSSAVSFSDFGVGSLFCHKTSDGRYGRFEIERVETDSIRVDFLTWK